MLGIETYGTNGPPWRNKSGADICLQQRGGGGAKKRIKTMEGTLKGEVLGGV